MVDPFPVSSPLSSLLPSSYFSCAVLVQRTACVECGVQAADKCQRVKCGGKVQGVIPQFTDANTPWTSVAVHTAWVLSVVVMIKGNVYGEAPSRQTIQGC